MRGLISRMFGQFTAWISEPVLVSDNIHLSWSDVELQKFDTGSERNVYAQQPRIFLYARKNCPVCQELKLWLEYLWIPHTVVECTPLWRQHVPKFRHLQQYFVFKAKTKKSSGRVFMPLLFPQLDVCRANKKGKYVWTRYVGNSRRLREHVENFIAGHIGSFPGFESGVYGDLTPEQSAKQQHDAIISEQAELARTESN